MNEEIKQLSWWSLDECSHDNYSNELTPMPTPNNMMFLTKKINELVKEVNQLKKELNK